MSLIAAGRPCRHFWHVLVIRAVFLTRSFRPASRGAGDRLSTLNESNPTGKMTRLLWGFSDRRTRTGGFISSAGDPGLTGEITDQGRRFAGLPSNAVTYQGLGSCKFGQMDYSETATSAGKHRIADRDRDQKVARHHPPILTRRRLPGRRAAARPCSGCVWWRLPYEDCTLAAGGS